MTPTDDTPASPPPAGADGAFEPAATRPAPPPAGNPSLEHTVERLVHDLLRDRRSERRWRVFFRLAWFGLFVAVAYAIFVESRGPAAPAGPHTALVEVSGAIAVDAEASADTIVSGLRAAFEDKGAQAVVLRINSPGGSPVQAGIVHDEIRRLKALHGKPVYAVVEEVCASGAYYIAAAADEIFVDKASLVGSIGVLMDGFGFTGAMDKLGIERRLLTAGENKGMLDPFSPQNERHVAHAQALIDQIHQQFIAVVRQGRGDRLRDTPELFSGLFWNGEQAIELGLADRTGSLDYVAREIVKAEDIIDYTQRGNLAERLARRFGAGVGESLAIALRHLAPALR
ncbi:S49 family peptidase [Azohydromonas sediminis]|uniref:S49 family peptidase n=1 Tax=Azohydromonas sediminis TaxID=2259674 RepID=UPI000E64DF89|nr:S49 family peptidase [Azohydromonas sediminis]